MKNEEKLVKLLDDLREFVINNVESKDKVMSDEEDLSKSPFDKLYNIDIYFSRKPGMRASVQTIMADNTSPEVLKVSCMTAISSLLDTMCNKNMLNYQDVLLFMATWIKAHREGEK